MAPPETGSRQEREFFIDNLLVRIHFIIVMIRWTGLAPWEFEFNFPGSLTSTFLGQVLAKVDPFVPQSQHVNLRIVRISGDRLSAPHFRHDFCTLRLVEWFAVPEAGLCGYLGFKGTYGGTVMRFT